MNKLKSCPIIIIFFLRELLSLSYQHVFGSHHHRHISKHLEKRCVCALKVKQTIIRADNFFFFGTLFILKPVMMR